MEALRASKHRVNLVLLWINELATSLHSRVDTPAPILSRVFQELSNGALGYNQAEKLSDVPFPFVFAQLLAVMILFFALCSPLAFTLLTGESWLTPLISATVVVSFWALNEIAKELENPFGNDANTVPLVDAHERFVEFVAEMYGSSIPLDRDYVKEGLMHSSEDAEELESAASAEEQTEPHVQNEHDVQQSANGETNPFTTNDDITDGGMQQK